MSFPRKAVFLFLVALLLVIAVGACADGRQVYPGYSEMRAFKQEELRRVRQLKNAAADGVYYGYDDVQINISGKKQPTATLTFTAALTGVQDASEYIFRWGISDEERDPYGYLFYPQNSDMTGKSEIKYTFFSAGSYSCYVDVYDKDGNWFGWSRLDFAIEDDGKHPTMEQKAAQIVSACQGKDSWHTALNLYDWLTHHAYYDASLDYHGADILFYGYGVCDSYSKAYMLLCQTAGITAERVYGPSHAWNAMQLDGKWYQADPTWDDPNTSMPGEGEPVSGYEGHEFFCLSAAAMIPISYHSYSDGSQEGAHAASCTSMDANYYIHEGLWESFGDRQYDWYSEPQESVNPYVKQIEDWFGEGNSSFEKTLSGWLYYYDQNGNIQGTSFYNSILREIMKAGLSGYKFMLGGVKINVRTSISDEMVLTAELLPAEGIVNLPAGILEIQSSAFEKTAVKMVIIPEGCGTIGARAFANNGIISVVVPLSVENIADDAFSGCETVTMITSNPTAISYANDHGIIVESP